MSEQDDSLEILEKAAVANIKMWPQAKFVALADHLGCDPAELEGVDLVALIDALKWADEQSGWKGGGPEDREKYYCEHCAADPELDSRDIKHLPDCATHRIRQALAQLPERKT